MDLSIALTYLYDYCQDSFFRIHKAQSIAGSCHEFFYALIVFCTAKYPRNVILVAYSEGKNDTAV